MQLVSDIFYVASDTSPTFESRGRGSTRVPGYSSSFIITRLDNSVTTTR